MATGLSFSFNYQGFQFPLCHRHQQSQPGKMTSQQQKPLRHSIDAILEKPSPSSSPSGDKTPVNTVVSLPSFDVLARRASLRLVTSESGENTTDVENTMTEASDSSSDRDVDGDEEADDVIVVDEAEEDSDQNDKQFNTDGRQQNILPGTCRDLTNSVGNNEESDGPPTPPRAPADACGNLSHSKTHTDTVEVITKVRSAFRPIVRPWLAGEAGENSSAVSMVSTSQCPQSATLQTSFEAATNNSRSGSTPLDAISMLRRQSSAFRPCGNRMHMGQGYLHVNSNGSRMMLPNGVGTGLGQPLPGNLASWFSWLRAGHHVGVHPVQHHPGQGVQRGVHGPPNVPPHAPPPQAPRYNCEACGKSYSTFGGLSKHKQFHCSAQVKKDFRCKFCDKSYSSLGALKMHIRTHTLPCKCTVCGKAFSRPWLLQGHVRTHTGEKPFSCPHCSRAFADRSNLRAHLQTHSDVKKYSCRACSKTFSRMSLLVKHRESSCLALQR